ncbi:hypothetical protein GCU67_19840 [Modestobacter muralis]|uniref:Uncharacterized protein n=1 Tax=Modestobacter muralis TaxID=1608614 RepID=A0A6P0HDV9_9ACTN|nr:hypothetical protein [Modestobacter muralis]NEK96399.1 hypothetical protein [Modestobacter muralis]NEN53299.1 hypothetical protein [Modestobacter muralis]
MSLVLDAWIKACSPAIGLDQLVLLHVSDELNIPDTTVEQSVPSGDAIGPSYQHQNVHRRTGGGYLSMRDLGARIWCDSRLSAAEWNAGARVRRLRGLPNPGGQAYFPPLLWTVQGGRYRDDFTGQILNRREVWRIPLVREAALVRVPASAPAAKKDGWSVARGWKDAEDAIVEARRERAVQSDPRAPWDDCAARDDVRKYLAQCRAVQEAEAMGDIDTAEVRGVKVIPGAYLGGGAEHAAALDAIGQRAAANVAATSADSRRGNLPGATPVGGESSSPWDE